MKRKQVLSISLISFMFLGCVSIPPEAPELSMELGKRISAIEVSNIKLLNRFFDEKRERVDEFIVDEWVPAFAEEVFSGEASSMAWDTIVKENDKRERLKYLLIMGPELQKKINVKRLELIQPLDTLERKIEKEIRVEYAQARAINSSISSFLLSAAEVAENRTRYLEMIGVTDEKIDYALNKTDEIVSGLLKKGEGIPNKVKKTEEFIKKVQSLRDSI